VKWYKLVGSTTPGQQVDEDWEHKDPGNFTAIRFPWNKPPTQICLHDGVIVQAVVDTGLMAVQRVVGQPGINPRRGPKGSLNDRWPHTIEVETECFCSPLKSAPKLRDVYPAFADKYGAPFPQRLALANHRRRVRQARGRDPSGRASVFVGLACLRDRSRSA
jgi:hypothetical protein